MKFNAVRMSALGLTFATGLLSLSGSAFAMGCLPANLDVNAVATLSSTQESTDDNWAVYNQMVNGNRCDTGAKVSTHKGELLSYAPKAHGITTPATDELVTFTNDKDS